MIQIQNWSSSFENSDTRKRQRLGWFLAPSGCDSKGYRLLMREGSVGVAALGVFQALCQIMATLPKETRESGKLTNSDGTGMEVADLWEMTRIQVADLEQGLELLEKVGWLALINQQSASDVPPPCHLPATSVPENSGFVKGEGEGEGEGEGVSDSPPPVASDETREFLTTLWGLSPTISRPRTSKKDVSAEWKRIPAKDKPEKEAVIKAYRAWLKCEAWTKDGGQFVCGLHLWIKKRQWENVPTVKRGEEMEVL
jgi:hypothetical protein